MSIIVLENDYIKATLNTFGGLIEGLLDKKTGLEHAWKYDSALWPRRTAVCFPFCGKSKDGKYSYKGKEYEIPNHGFARERDFAVLSSTSSHLELEDRFDQATLCQYPFKYSLRIEYTLDGASFEVKYHVTNEGQEPMYYSIGSHYAYQLPLNQTKCALWFSKPQHAGGLSLADGSTEPDILQGRSAVPFPGLIDDNSLILTLKDLDTDWVGVGDLEKVFTKVSGEGFKFVLAWAPVGGNNPFVCIEFWDGMADLGIATGKIEEKFAVNKLESGQSRLYKQTVNM